MKLNTLLNAGLLGLSLSIMSAAPILAQAKKNVVRVTSNQTSESIVVPLNRAIVLEADQSFAELSVANPGIADIATLSDRTIYVLGKTPGRTTLTLLGADGRLITNVNIVVNPDLAELKELINEIMPGEKIEIRAANDGVVISGVASSSRVLARVIELAGRYSGKVSNLATVGGSQQVMLKVRFAEMSRSVAKGLSGSVALNGASGDNFAVTGTLIPTVGSSTPILDVGSLGAVGSIFNLGSTAVSVLIEALENKGLVRTLAEPNLVTVSGNEARFLAGGEVPIPFAASDSITVSYKPFGVQMQFTPTVIDGDLINLSLETEVSEIDFGNAVDFGSGPIPAFSVRRASTVVEMKDGESIAIAGLLQDTFSDNISQLPWLGDVPILGSLFKSTNYARKQSELVIIVTPHLVNPVDGSSLILPTDRVRIPTERELFLLGKTSKKGSTSTGSGAVATQDFSGSYGYVLE